MCSTDSSWSLHNGQKEEWEHFRLNRFDFVAKALLTFHYKKFRTFGVVSRPQISFHTSRLMGWRYKAQWELQEPALPCFHRYPDLNEYFPFLLNGQIGLSGHDKSSIWIEEITCTSLTVMIFEIGSMCHSMSFWLIIEFTAWSGLIVVSSIGLRWPRVRLRIHRFFQRLTYDPLSIFQ